jgi:hypothetical protein
VIVNVGTFYSLTVPVERRAPRSMRLSPNSRRPATEHRPRRREQIEQRWPRPLDSLRVALRPQQEQPEDEAEDQVSHQRGRHGGRRQVKHQLIRNSLRVRFTAEVVPAALRVH